MFEMEKPRYVKQQIASKVSLEIQGLLWKMIDIQRDRGETLDYIQVFSLQRSSDIQVITNKQEQPPMAKVVSLRTQRNGTNRNHHLDNR